MSSIRERHQKNDLSERNDHTMNSTKKGASGRFMLDQYDEHGNCPICLNPVCNPRKLDKCGHVFCKACIDRRFLEFNPVCPSCNMVYGEMRGNQPDGQMDVNFSGEELPGYEGHGIITITYSFSNGWQKEKHPYPGDAYKETTHQAFLPDTWEGRQILSLLRKAFDLRLIFTIGRSTSMGQDDVIAWNDIHHKTNKIGGPTRCGYPDATYLSRVREELASKGVTESTESRSPKWQTSAKEIRNMELNDRAATNEGIPIDTQRKSRENPEARLSKRHEELRYSGMSSIRERHQKNDLSERNDHTMNSTKKGASGRLMLDQYDEHGNCPICLNPVCNPRKLDKCGHVFCKACIDRRFLEFNPVCPSCNMVYGEMRGNQPNGQMDVNFSGEELPGYEGHGIITITYSFANGWQKEKHPYPGDAYKETTHQAFLPDTWEGRQILSLLRKAFDLRLIFTIGRSTSMGQDDVIAWNDIHHKTNKIGGPTRCGYPDATYLSRVREELASKGVTESTESRSPKWQTSAKEIRNMELNDRAATNEGIPIDTQRKSRENPEARLSKRHEELRYSGMSSIRERHQKNDLSERNDHTMNSTKKGASGRLMLDQYDEHGNCPICLNPVCNPRKLDKCGHVFCKACIDRRFLEFNPVCPSCNMVYGEMRGNQQNGQMDVNFSGEELPGYEGHGIITITYSFANGWQKEKHPYPGDAYKETTHQAFLPDTWEGRQILSLLRKAFDLRLIFTIGRSTSMGQDDVIAWNDIHHKTNKIGGPTRCGYPDATYLSRVREELASKGVTESTESRSPKWQTSAKEIRNMELNDRAATYEGILIDTQRKSRENPEARLSKRHEELRYSGMSSIRERHQKNDLSERNDHTMNSTKKGASGRFMLDQYDEHGNCPICLNPVCNPRKLDKCGHVFCKACIDRRFLEFNPVCPSCNMVYGEMRGNQPNGQMDVNFSGEYLPGYEGHGIITITYSFSNGWQKEKHPYPGDAYKETTHQAFLPDTWEGRQILSLLRKAFDLRLIFTIGRSTSMGQDDVITWNDIHHKTNKIGGPTRCGYPDATYLSRVREELASKGVTESTESRSPKWQTSAKEIRNMELNDRAATYEGIPIDTQRKSRENPEARLSQRHEELRYSGMSSIRERHQKNDLSERNDHTMNSTKKGASGRFMLDQYDEHGNCPICLNPVCNPRKLDKCGHVFCKACIDRRFLEFNPVCPSCNMVYGEMRGNQPNGQMDVNFSGEYLPGYEGHGIITITYSFSNGWQKEKHPYPGDAYKETTHQAFLPDTREGRQILSLLRKAFDLRLIFTIGRSTCMGQDDVIAWNDIHHKTNKIGGPTRCGYPDATYLSRVREELASKGVTESTESRSPKWQTSAKEIRNMELNDRAATYEGIPIDTQRKSRENPEARLSQRHEELRKLDKCGHVFCKACIDRRFLEFNPVCPSCNMVYGEMRGNQPDGQMDVNFSGEELPGYEGHGIITITYSFSNGWQKTGDPNPGQPYKGTTRRAYLPDNKEGKQILQLLRTAFDRKLIFTIGSSTTTGEKDELTWNDIHHKTNIDGGPTRCGYPDQTYLSRVREELASKGVTESTESISNMKLNNLTANCKKIHVNKVKMQNQMNYDQIFHEEEPIDTQRKSRENPEASLSKRQEDLRSSFGARYQNNDWSERNDHPENITKTEQLDDTDYEHVLKSTDRQLQKVREVARGKGFTWRENGSGSDLFTSLSQQVSHVLREEIDSGHLRVVVARYLKKDKSLEDFFMETSLEELLTSVEKGYGTKSHYIISSLCNALKLEVLLLPASGEELLFQPFREKEFLPQIVLGAISENRFISLEHKEGHDVQDIPSTWSRNSKDTELVTLRAESAEFQEVQQSFLSSIGRSKDRRVIQIQRVQSTTQWKYFNISREHMAHRYPDMTSERRLWHGTSEESIKLICKEGFNRSFCGKNATRYGQGTYFSDASCYAAKDTYSVPGEDGYKYMFRARVLTGHYTKGERGMKVPPWFDEKELVRFDSVVDNVDKPTMFVLFRDYTSYPEYLIKLK